MIIQPDDQFPYMANVAQIQKNKKGGYSVVAKKDIDVGQIIIAEDAYIAHLFDHYGLMCKICAKEFVNLVPCKMCATAMFCTDCQEHFLHQYECGLKLCGESQFNSLLLGAVRGILLTIKAFPNVDELINLVERIRANPNELPMHLMDDRSKYQAYIRSALFSNYKTVDEMAQTVYPVYKLLWRIQHVKEMFKLEEHRRFFIHLIGLHMLIPQCAAGTTFANYSNPSFGLGVLMLKYFKNSCHPNLTSMIRNGQNIWFSVKPIKKGEQLYFSSTPIEIDTKERQEFLWTRMQMKCSCRRCDGKVANPAQRQQLVTDPAYHYFVSNKRNLAYMDIEKFKPLMDSCVTILRTYGHLQWCKEFGEVVDLYQTLFFVQSTGGTDFHHPLARAFISKMK